MDGVEWAINPDTGRFIKVGGPKYRSLLAKGYAIQDTLDGKIIIKPEFYKSTIISGVRGDADSVLTFIRTQWNLPKDITDIVRCMLTCVHKPFCHLHTVHFFFQKNMNSYVVIVRIKAQLHTVMKMVEKL